MYMLSVGSVLRVLKNRLSSCPGQVKIVGGQVNLPATCPRDKCHKITYYWSNNLSLSNFTLAKVADKYENVWTSRSLDYLSPGQAEIIHNLEPWCTSIIQELPNGYTRKHAWQLWAAVWQTVHELCPRKGRALYPLCNNLFFFCPSVWLWSSSTESEAKHQHHIDVD